MFKDRIKQNKNIFVFKTDFEKWREVFLPV